MKTLTSKIHKYYDLEQNYFAPSSLPKILDVGRIVQSFEKNSYYELVLSSISLTVYVKIIKDCLWNELQNNCVESTEKKISLSAD